MTLKTLAAALNVSPYHLQRTFKRTFGLSPKQYQSAQKLDQVRTRLKEGADVLSATYDAGYGSSSRLYERANEGLGMTPGAYRRGGIGMNIRFVITTTSLGKLLVGLTARGVCAVWFGENDKELEQDLRQEFFNATIQRADGQELEAIVDDVVAAIEKPNGGGKIPIDIVATTFQMRVWSALREIPRGATRSYGEIAAAIGKPDAARAVGSACAKNRVAYLIPCHRAVPASGGSGKYRWGSSRKQELLKREKK